MSAGNLRVRDLGDRASIELDRVVLALLGDRSELADGVTGCVVAAGFPTAAIDPRGFRSGSMNELLAQPEHFR